MKVENLDFQSINHWRLENTLCKMLWAPCSMNTENKISSHGRKDSEWVKEEVTFIALQSYPKTQRLGSPPPSTMTIEPFLVTVYIGWYYDHFQCTQSEIKCHIHKLSIGKTISITVLKFWNIFHAKSIFAVLVIYSF